MFTAHVHCLTPCLASRFAAQLCFPLGLISWMFDGRDNRREGLWCVVKQVPGDLTNDVGKMFFFLMKYALGHRLGRQTGEIIENSTATV